MDPRSCQNNVCITLPDWENTKIPRSQYLTLTKNNSHFFSNVFFSRFNKHNYKSKHKINKINFYCGAHRTVFTGCVFKVQCLKWSITRKQFCYSLEVLCRLCVSYCRLWYVLLPRRHGLEAERSHVGLSLVSPFLSGWGLPSGENTAVSCCLFPWPCEFCVSRHCTPPAVSMQRMR